MAEQFQRLGVLKSLYTSYYGRFGNRRNNIGISLRRERVRTYLPAAIVHYGYNPGDLIFKFDLFGKWVARNLRDEDVIISWGLSALPIIKRARELGIITIVERGSAHVVVQKDLLIAEHEEHNSQVELERLRHSFTPARMERELLEYELADYIQVPSTFAVNSFVEQGIPREKLIRNSFGVDLKSFHQIPKQDRVFRVVFAGGMTLQKGVHYLLQAFAELKLPNAELWLLGRKFPQIEPFFKRYDGSYRYFGQVPQQALHQYYSQSSVFAICSIQEGMAMVQPQAMACGLPLLCTTNTGGADLIVGGREGFVIPIRDVNAIKEKLLYLYEHQEECHEMGQAAKRAVQRGFTWNDYGDRMVQMFARIVESKQK